MTALGLNIAGMTSNRLELLTTIGAVGIKLWEWQTPEQTNINSGDDPQVEIGRLPTPADIDAVFSRFGTAMPWGSSEVEQGAVLSVVGTLAALAVYVAENDSVPRPDVYWVLRCADGYSVRWSPGDGLSIDSLGKEVVRSYVGALTEE